MGLPGKPEAAILINAITYRHDVRPEDVQEKAISPFGEVQEQLPAQVFEHSAYYADEMGTPLNKTYVAYKGSFPVADAVQVKMKAIRVEQETAIDGKRTINIDPGYLTLAKFVLTTTKNFDHRIHIGDCIYGDVQLRYRKGEFVTNPWTYPDYKQTDVLRFLEKTRKDLHAQQRST